MANNARLTVNTPTGLAAGMPLYLTGEASERGQIEVSIDRGNSWTGLGSFLVMERPASFGPGEKWVWSGVSPPLPQSMRGAVLRVWVRLSGTSALATTWLVEVADRQSLIDA